MSSALMLEQSLDQEALERVRQAAHRAGLDQHDPGFRPDVVVAGLASGERRLPADVLAAAEPDLAVILLCRDALLQPSVIMAGGRLTLLPIRCPVEDLAEHLRLAAKPLPRIRERVGDRRWSAVRIGGRSVVSGDDGILTCLVASRSLGGVERVARGTAERSEAARLLPSLLAKGGAWAAGAVLDGEQRTWTLAWPGTAPRRRRCWPRRSGCRRPGVRRRRPACMQSRRTPAMWSC